MKHIVLISGFTEDRHAMTGTRKIYRELVDEYGDDVTLCEWNDDFEQLAEHLQDVLFIIYHKDFFFHSQYLSQIRGYFNHITIF